MAETDFDIIVVGAGCAGSVAAYTAASAGKSVLLVERGVNAGAKNMSGGRIYSHALAKVFPDFAHDAPLERKITHERLAFMDSSRNLTVDFTSPELAQAGADSYSVLRGPFDAWLSGKAEDAGAECVFGISVDSLLKGADGRVIGIRAGEDEISAQVVILAEGCNTLLGERCLGNARPASSQMAVGVKEVFELNGGSIEDRFLLPKGEGAAMLFVGDYTHGKVGGGFLYTNKDSISLGLVATISSAADASNPTPVYQMFDDFERHPAVVPILRDAKMVEHSGHMVPEGGYDMVPTYIFDGALVAGEAAGLCMNMGYQVRGMDFAVASGQMAALSAVDAISADDTSANGLASYRSRMEESFVMRDLATFRRWPSTMEHWDSLFTDYPTCAAEAMNAMFCVDGTPQKPLKQRMMPILKQRGLWKLAQEMRKGVKAL